MLLLLLVLLPPSVAGPQCTNGGKEDHVRPSVTLGPFSLPLPLPLPPSLSPPKCPSLFSSKKLSSLAFGRILGPGHHGRSERENGGSRSVMRTEMVEEQKLEVGKDTARVESRQRTNGDERERTESKNGGIWRRKIFWHRTKS